jgi:hypothetical protein
MPLSPSPYLAQSRSVWPDDFGGVHDLLVMEVVVSVKLGDLMVKVVNDRFGLD